MREHSVNTVEIAESFGTEEDSIIRLINRAGLVYNPSPRKANRANFRRDH
jgi:phage regulator Rha-like protein